MPRNDDVMALCQELERVFIKITPSGPEPKFDRTAYMREYMRQRRRRKQEGA